MSFWTPRHTLVERHFATHNSAADERRMWRHLNQCARCRTHYRRASLLELLDATSDADAALRVAPTEFALLPARDRLGRALFAPARAEASPRLAWLSAAGAAACALALLLHPGLPETFQARGAHTAAPSLPRASVDVYLVGTGAEAHSPRVGSLLSRGMALALTYRNADPRPFSHLLVFARDPQGKIYWLVPHWRDASQLPHALPIASGAAQHELPEAVRHDFPLGPLELVSIFCQRSFDVREIERLVERDARALDTLDGVLVERRTLQVVR